MKKFNNNEFNINNINEEVTLFGWVNKKRNLGGLIFIDLRDRSGLIQVVVRPENSFYEIADKVRNEYVLKVNGKIVERENKNQNLATGEIEVEVESLEILNESADLPFQINDTTALEDTRLKYRYLDIRRDNIKNNLILRNEITLATRNFLCQQGFIEVETPILCKSTPEGARDYLVPSRVNNGKFYALPQSPQIFKQMLMVGGIEKYFQIAKCFRDEDLRADRQPEFTQIDLEMSFVEENDIISLTENLLADIFKKTKNIEITLPIERMTYLEAYNKYGSDKPDLRFDLPIEDITSLFNNTNFSLFENMIKNNGIINAIVVKNSADKFSRKDIDNLTEIVKTYKASGLAYLKYVDSEFNGSLAKLEELEELKSKLNLENNDIVFVVADKYETVKNALGNLRIKLAHNLSLIDENSYRLLWIVDFPLFEYSEEDNRYYAKHHPFTAPKDSDIDKLVTNQGECLAKAYDIVVNGYEVGGGSIRIFNPQVQKKMFETLGFTEEEANNQFGFMINAFKYGTPPHGGLALGLDRLTMLLGNTENIRDVIAFPKTASASDLMSEAPNEVSEKQLKELGIKLNV